MKFGVPMQNEMPITNGKLASKPEIEFQYGGCSFFIPEVAITQP